MFASHSGKRGRLYQAQFAALRERYGPFDAVARCNAAAAAVLWVEFQTATAAVQAAEDVRARGKGRRPSAAGIEKLKRRQGLSWGSYQQAERRLEELAARRNDHRGPSLADVMADANG